MSDDLQFAEFRVRVEQSRKVSLGTAPPRGFNYYKAVMERCRWVSANGLYCFGDKQREDSRELLEFFDKHPDVHELTEFPEHLFDNAFCELHAAMAKLPSQNNKVDAAEDGALIKHEDGGKDKQIVLWRAQYLSFGDDNQIQVTLGEKSKEEGEHEAVFYPKTRTVRLKPKDVPLHTQGSKQVGKSRESEPASLEGSKAESKIADDSDDDALDHERDRDSTSTRTSEDEHEEVDEDEVDREDIDTEKIDGDETDEGEVDEEEDEEGELDEGEGGECEFDEGDGGESEFDEGEDGEGELDEEEGGEGELKEEGYSQSRVRRYLKTRRRDGIYFRTVDQADEEIADTMRAPLRIKKGIPGYVYAFRDHELNLVKVGFAEQSISARLITIKSACHVGKPMTILAGEHLEHVLEYKRLEKLLHAYLQPHRWSFKCKCGAQGNTLHGEYFDISNKVAKAVFSVWRKFILEKPYSRGTSPTWYTLHAEWRDRIRDLERPSKTERHEDHEPKLERWRRILRQSNDEIPTSKTAGDADQGIEDLTTDTLWSITGPEEIERPQSASPSQMKQHKAPDALTTISASNQASLGVPAESSRRSRSVPSSPPRWSLFGTASTQNAAALSKKAEAIKPHPMGLDKEDNPVRPASSAGEINVFGSSRLLTSKEAEAIKGHLKIPKQKYRNARPAPSAEDRQLFASSLQSLLKEGDHTVRPASSAGERTLLGSSTQPRPKASNSFSIPRTEFTYTAPFPGRLSAPYQTEDKACQVKLDGPSTTLKEERPIQENTSPTIADTTPLRPPSSIDWAAKYRELEKMMHLRRKGLASRSIWEDLVQFRWPISFAMCLAMCSSYVPGSWAFVTWILLLPCFVAELRSWFPEVGHGN